MKLQKKSTAALAGLMAVAVIGGSFAYWNQTAEINNPFDTSKYGSTVVENFKPEEGEDWQPGIDVNKDVVAVNEGDTDLIVRARLDETWTRKGDTAAYKDSKNDPFDVYNTNQADATDGLTAADGSVVTKKFDPTTTNWIDGGDGWYYYKANLAGGATTDKWLDSVELLNDADMGKMKTVYYVTTDATVGTATKWFPYTGKMPAYILADGSVANKGDAGALPVMHNKTETSYNTAGEMGYSNSDYNLKVTVQTVQATQEAIDAVFGGGTTFTAPTGTTWTVR
ncbi:MAG: BsaA family SipW-dependent biofilm matrix protein [Gemmiger sp.]|nr:BsaA family SipW-dependent biofilm matrix protein [Gemmiger sp.]